MTECIRSYAIGVKYWFLFNYFTYCFLDILILWWCIVAVIVISQSLIHFRILSVSWGCHARSFARGVNPVQNMFTTLKYVKKARPIDNCIMCNQSFFMLCFINCIFFFVCVDAFVGAYWFALLRITFIDDNALWFALIRRTDLRWFFVCKDLFWFALVRITNVQDRNLLHASHFRSYRVNVQF